MAASHGWAACPGSGLVELPLHLLGEGPAGHHGPAHKLFGDLFGEGAASALHSLARHQHAVCNKRSGHPAHCGVTENRICST